MLALEPIPITAITAAVPIIIAKEVRKDLIALDFIHNMADVNDSFRSITDYPKLNDADTLSLNLF